MFPEPILKIISTKNSINLRQPNGDNSEYSDNCITIPVEHWNRLDGIIRELTGHDKETYAKGFHDGELAAKQKYEQEDSNETK